MALPQRFRETECVFSYFFIRDKILFVMGICIILMTIGIRRAKNPLQRNKGKGCNTEHANVQSHPGQCRFRLNVASPSEKSGWISKEPTNYLCSLLSILSHPSYHEPVVICVCPFPTLTWAQESISNISWKEQVGSWNHWKLYPQW